MHCNNKQGFTILEALLALVVLVLSLTPIMMVQINGVRATSKYARLFDRIQQGATFMHTLLVNSTTMQTKTQEKTIQRPATTITVTQERPPQNSSLGVFKSLQRVVTRIRWREGSTEHTDALMTCWYHPPQEES